METVQDKKRKERYIKEYRIMENFGRNPPELMLLHYAPGELLSTSFSPGVYMQFVVEGSLLLYDMPDESSTVMLQTNFNKVTLLGEMELLNSGFDPFFLREGDVRPEGT